VSRTIYFDCYAGASGDMVLGALLDAGVPLAELRKALGSLALDVSVDAQRVSRAGVAATKFSVTANDHHHHGHHHQHEHHDHHEHRSVPEIVQLIDQSALSTAAKTRAGGLIRRLAEAEAAIHQMPVERVHLHEVGALDSIVDIAGAVFAMEWLGIDDVVASPLNVGGGMVTCAHGTFPVPAPATARLLTGTPTYSTGAVGELVTPTGALLVTEYARSFGAMPLMQVERIGYGAGDRDPAGFPNTLRVFVGERMEPVAALKTGHSTTAPNFETIVSIECEIDDMNPQIFGPLMDRLLAAGALDVFYQAVQMKKSRPGTLVTVLAPPDRREALAELLFRESTTIGLRWREMSRERLDRETVRVETALGEIGIKVARRGGRVVNAQPEFDECVRLAEAHGVAIKDVQAIAMRAYLSK
jgi:pyridinium-3,5-bisthiocarboxylic acid mononucleotide nickel chelatase